MIPTLQLGGLGRIRQAAGGAAGTFPNYLSATATGFTTAATTQNVPMPATVANGDRLVMQFATPSTLTPTTPSGWTLIQANTRTAWYWRNANGTEGGTTVAVVMSTSQRATAIVHRIQAGTFDTAVAPALVRTTGVSGANPNPGSLSPAWGAADTLWIAAFSGVDNGTVSVYPYAGGNTHVRADPAGSGTSFCESASCWTKVNAASLDPGTFTRTSTGSPWDASTVAVKPV